MPGPGQKAGGSRETAGVLPNVAEENSIVTGLAGRYAIALYELARDDGSLSQVERDLDTLKRAIQASADLAVLIRNPIYSREVQWKAMEAVILRMQLSDLVRRFVGVITHNRRLFALTDIIDGFSRIAADARGEVTATVRSAAPLSAQQVENLKAALRQALGRQVNITSSVDPELLGGLIVRLGSVMVDSTIRSQLNRLQVAMREVS